MQIIGVLESFQQWANKLLLNRNSYLKPCKLLVYLKASNNEQTITIK